MRLNAIGGDMKRINHAENAALRKIPPVPEEFKFRSWEVIATDGVLYKGGVTRKITKGPRKGRLTWGKISHAVVITRADEQNERSRYETETGLCSECAGTGQMWVRWNVNTGNHYMLCDKCGGKGLSKCD